MIIVVATSNRRAKNMITAAHEPTSGNFGRKIAIGATAGVAAGPLANLLRKAAVQAPTAMAGNWDTALGSGLVDHSQKMTVAARATAEKKTVGHRS